MVQNETIRQNNAEGQNEEVTGQNDVTEHNNAAEQNEAAPKNILKVRDDQAPIIFKRSNDIDSTDRFALREGHTANWFSGCSFSVSDLKNRVEPWLTSLFQSEHLSLLAGSGLTTAIQCEAVNHANNGMQNPELKSAYKQKIDEAVIKSVERTARGNPNIEDYIRVMNDLLRGLEILQEEEYGILREELDAIISDFAKNISSIEYQIITADDEKRVSAFNKLVMFLMSFASRTGTRDRLNIFTTNYDRLIEVGAELAGLHLLDRFVGTLSPIFRSSRLDLDMHYNPPGIRGEPRYLEGVARYTKLHGSIDWVNSKNDIRKIGLPFGAVDIKPYLSAPGISEDATNIMIYPNASKDRETAEYPYVELFRDFASAICRPNSTLVTYGYSFGDEHINRILRDMLTIPSTHLVIIAYNDEGGRIMKSYTEFGRSTQISLIIGPDVAGIGPLTTYFLPKPSIDRNTIRMAELLKQRYSDNHMQDDRISPDIETSIESEAEI